MKFMHEKKDREKKKNLEKYFHDDNEFSFFI